jgi:hypothetical protein
MIEPIISPYLTLIPDRAPKQKAHMSLGQAKKAVLYRLHREALSIECLVYQWDSAKGWVKMWDIPRGTRREDMPWNSQQR